MVCHFPANGKRFRQHFRVLLLYYHQEEITRIALIGWDCLNLLEYKTVQTIQMNYLCTRTSPSSSSCLNWIVHNSQLSISNPVQWKKRSACPTTTILSSCLLISHFLSSSIRRTVCSVIIET